jgi:hypothetical protein
MIASPAAAAVVSASAQVMTLAPGLYTVDIGATETARAGRRMVLPCVRGDEFCGRRGMSLAMVGRRVRLVARGQAI